MDKEKFRETYRIESARLPMWDYSSPGSYFITICSRDREHFFGHIQRKQMKLNPIGQMIDSFWKQIPTRFPHVHLDRWVIMPNHVHGILTLKDIKNHVPRRDAINRVSTGNGAPGGITRSHNPMLNPKSISHIIRWFKGRSTYEIRKQIHPDFAWQARFHDRVIRNNRELSRIRYYIMMNPLNWERDRNNVL